MGRKLVEELSIETSMDTLGLWMAHYLAELIADANKASPEERSAAQKRCFDAILELWSHRAELPDGKRPFESLEPITRAVESLDPDNDMPRYFNKFRGNFVDEDEDSQTQTLLEFVNAMDSATRILISYALTEAARSAVDKSKEWVTLVKSAGLELEGSVEIVIRVFSGVEEADEADPNKHERELLQNRLSRLEAFAGVAELVRENIKKHIDALQPPKS